MTKAKKISDALVIDIKFKEQNKTTHFTVYGKNSIGVYSYNAIMNPDTDCSQFIAIPDGDITHITFKAMEGYKKECKILISNPHNLTGFILNDPAVSLQFYDLHFCRELKYFSIKNTGCEIRIEDLNNCWQLKRLELDGTKCDSDISTLTKFQDLVWASLDNTKCTGIVSALSKVNKLWRFSAMNSSIRGSINNMHCPHIGSLKVSGTKCYGDTNRFIKDNPDLEEIRMTDYYYHHTMA